MTTEFRNCKCKRWKCVGLTLHR